ncbi:MAG: hypothetical protein HY785_11255 [Oscillatoriophycideae cyanobacterium NC_groundwater_1537_Pr4_S-0.65um_50_18]|nr:hypothetical protein [Oscillatoriophycideae cyanobacterium NC_groundwater_1537_Pr4_S-0.65um_50_18]
MVILITSSPEALPYDLSSTLTHPDLCPSTRDGLLLGRISHDGAIDLG